MDKGRKILLSLGAGLVVLSLLDFNLPIYISVGITVFVTILTLHDFMNAGNSDYQYKLTNDKTLKKSEKIEEMIFFLVGNTLRIAKIVTEILLFLSIPISIFVSYIAFDIFSIDDLNRLQQTLTLYTLGLVITLLSFTKTKNNHSY